MEQSLCVQVSSEDLLRWEEKESGQEVKNVSLRGEGDSRRVWTNPMSSRAQQLFNNWST